MKSDMGGNVLIILPITHPLKGESLQQMIISMRQVLHLKVGAR